MNEDKLLSTEEPDTEKTILRAEDILISKETRFRKVTRPQKHNIVVAFARDDKPVYGEAFDLVSIEGEVNLDLEEDVYENIKKITLIEIKSTRKKKSNGDDLNENFDGYFFGLTTAELLVAQKLQEKYVFIFINTNTGIYKEMTLNQIFVQAKAIYPQWSIRF